MIGNELSLARASSAIVVAMCASLVSTLGFKLLHDFVKERNEALVERYVEIVGRVTALFVGTYAVEMLMTAFERMTAI